MLEFSSTVLPAPSPYRMGINLPGIGIGTVWSGDLS